MKEWKEQNGGAGESLSSVKIESLIRRAQELNRRFNELREKVVRLEAELRVAENEMKKYEAALLEVLGVSSMDEVSVAVRSIVNALSERLREIERALNLIAEELAKWEARI